MQSKTIHRCIFIEDIDNFKIVFSQEPYHSYRAGVTLRHPVPNSISTYSSSIIGITLPQIGTIAFFLLNGQNVRQD
jgi:hypothetical protein